MTSVSHVLRPNEAVSSAASSYLVVFWIALALLVWIGAASPILPSPFAVIASVPGLWFQDGLGYQLWVSFGLNLQAIAIMVTLSLTISYATVMPAFRPVATFVSSGRFNGFCGLPLIFTLYIGDAHWIKVALLVYGMSVYTVPAVTKMMDLIPKENFDHARTLRMHEWRVVWEVVILGHFDDVIEIFRNTAAMGWMLLPMVEGLFKSEGGLGALVDIENKHFNIAAEFAIVFVILLVGLAQDYLIGVFKGIVCQYSTLGLERA